MSTVNITFKDYEGVGTITFTQPNPAFSTCRTAAGIRFQIPASIRFVPPQASQAPLILENLSVVLFVSGTNGEIEIGIARYEESLTTSNRDVSVTFSCDLTFSALAYYERLRDGQEPTFRFRVKGLLSYLIEIDGKHRIRSISFPYFADCHVRYSREVWVQTLRELNVGDCVLVEIPFPSDPPNQWDVVWQALRDARNSFESGGSTGWKNCVSSVRLALEKWRDLEAEDQGSGWKRPQQTELESRSKEQRLDAIRWHLVQYAHQGPHTTSEGWTRDDALLTLAALSALIAARKP